MSIKPSYEELQQEVRMLREAATTSRYMKDVYNCLKQSVIMLSPDLTILSANQATETITGLTAENLIGKKCHKIFHKSEVPPAGCPAKKVLTTGILKNVEMQIEAMDKIFFVACSPVFDDQSNIQRIIHICTDVTEKIKMEQRLQQSQKMEAIGTLAGSVAHEFNNMLAVIIGNISYALTLFEGNSKLLNVLLNIEKGANRAQNLTQQLLTLAKGGAPLKKAVDPNRLIKESAEFVLRGTTSRCDYNFHERLRSTEVDAGQISHAISNIIINASQAMSESGDIYIQSENTEIEPGNDMALTPGPYVKITIKDYGIGIPEKHISNIFEPYFSTKEKGSGLGLAVTYAIINRHGGNISVESSPGMGTTFYIYLPASEKIIDADGAKKTPDHSGSGNILIMDDQDAILDVASEILNLMGYQTLCAKDGEQAIEMYKDACESDKPIDLVILDLTVPGGVGGLEAMKKLMDINPKIVAVASSGYSNNPVMSNYQDYGFSGVVPKPYTVNDLSEVLNQLLDKE